jgi:thiol-disulfide isomerase/thioredoxin
MGLRINGRRVRWRRWRSGAATVALLLAVGCTKQPTNVAAIAPKKQTAAPNSANVDLRPVDRAELDALIATHRGKAVIVDFWATWCAPCIAQLPHTAKLAREGESRGLVVVTVCMDDPEDVASAAKLLAAKDATNLTNLISRDGGGSRAMEAFAIEGGALPYYQIYDATGKLHVTFGLDPAAHEQFTTDDLDAAVEKLLLPPQ